MKKVFMFVAILFVLIITGCGKNDDEIVMVTEAGFAPYEYYDNGEIVGVDVDIAKEIAKELGKKLVIKDVAFDSIINEVKTGKADFGAAGISYSDERAKEVDFSINYSVSKQVVVVKDDSNIKSTNDIFDKSIAVQLGSIADTFISEKYPNANIIRQKKYLSAIEDLKNDKVDCVVMDELPAKEILVSNSGLKILPGFLTNDSYGMIVKKGNTELLNTINTVLNRLVQDGAIDSYIIKHTGKKSAWYSGKSEIANEINLNNFDYIKIGPYIEEKGGLSNSNTNQRFYKVVGTILEDITYKFWKK